MKNYAVSLKSHPYLSIISTGLAFLITGQNYFWILRLFTNSNATIILSLFQQLNECYVKGTDWWQLIKKMFYPLTLFQFSMEVKPKYQLPNVRRRRQLYLYTHLELMTTVREVQRTLAISAHDA